MTLTAVWPRQQTPVETLRAAAHLLRAQAEQLEREANSLALHVHAWTSSGMHPSGMWGVAAQSPELLDGLVEEHSGQALMLARAVLELGAADV